MKIVVLAGGLSTERAVSLVTGTSVCRALRENGHRAVLVDLFLGLKDAPENLETLFDAPDGLCADASIGVEAPDLEAVRSSREDSSDRLFGPNVLELCALSDMVFLGLHGQDGEDGRVQATFDLLGIRYTGSGYLASGLAMDKVMTKRMMDSAGIPTPKWQLLEYGPEDVERLARELPMPCVIKTATGGSSLGVFLPEDRAALRSALEQVLEYRQAFDSVPPEQQAAMGDIALHLHHTLGLEVYSRTDFLMDADGHFWCLEVNSLPGMTSASLVPKEAAAVGMSYNALCEEIVQQSYRLKRRT